MARAPKDRPRPGEVIIRADWPKNMTKVVEVVAEDEGGIRWRLYIHSVTPASPERANVGD